MRMTLVSLALLAMLGCGGGSSSSLGAQFTQSATAPSPRLVKLIQKSKSNAQIVVSAVIYGPDTTLDMYSFAFDIKIGDPSVMKWVSGTGTAGNALTPFAGQTVQAVVGLGSLPGGGVDNSRVVVGVSKLGGGAGNGIAGNSATIVNVTFQVFKAGTTTLTLTGNPNPIVLDSNGAQIGSITFDSASASVKGVSSGGGGY